jgi:hypothetical protein
LIALGILSGCASIIDGGKTENVQITTTPSGANITVIDNRSGQTVFTGVSPTSVALNRSAGYFKGVSYTIRISKEGFRDQSLQIQSSINGWYVGNIVFGGLIGWLIVDPLTGAMYSLPDSASASLEASGKAAIFKDAKPGDLVITDLSSVPENLRPLLVALD